MRFSLGQYLMLASLTVLSACSGPDSSSVSKQSLPQAASKATPDTTSSVPAAPARPQVTYVHDVAAYLAGQAVSNGSRLQPLTQQPGWPAFAADADKSWTNYHATRTSKIEQWAATELDSVRRASPTVFYPFSGPDLLNVVTMFPASQTYVLVGLEPVGSVPVRTTLENPRLFSSVKASLWSVLNFSFFRTNDMDKDLKSMELDGALPLMMLFAARTDHQVQGIRYVQVDNQGQLIDADSTIVRKPGLKTTPGVEMTMLNKAGQEQKVYYFSADISDWKLGTTQEAILKYVRTLGSVTTYVKSATYLMHKPYFSKVRNLILEHSTYVLQDDSGIAMKYFRPADWELTYYGTYKRPINLFANRYQPELTRAYADTTHRPRPLPFGTGYNWRENDSNLLLAKRQKPVI